jgi:hypothetical protein
VQGGKCQLLVKLRPRDRQLYAVVPDTGAQLSLIREKLARQLHLPIFPPKREKYIMMADKSLVRRKGYVNVPITVLFQGTTRKPVVCVQQFEVFDIESDFLFGTDILPTLFPNDTFTQFMQPHASITSTPVLNLSHGTGTNDKNAMDVESVPIKLSDDETDATFVDVNVVSAVSYQLSEHNDEQSTAPLQKKKTKQKLNISKMKQYDDVGTKSIEQYIADELQDMQNEMKENADYESDNMHIDENLSQGLNESRRVAAVQAMREYFESHKIQMKGAWKSTSEQRVQRHLD